VVVLLLLVSKRRFNDRARALVKLRAALAWLWSGVIALASLRKSEELTVEGLRVPGRPGPGRQWPVTIGSQASNSESPALQVP
jgi:hypothetical protein